MSPSPLEVFERAHAYVREYDLRFADCFAAALAKLKKAHLITGDPEFKQIESEVSIEWLR